MESWNEGDRVFAYWDEDEYFYPATITSIDGEDICVLFDNGEEEWTTTEYLDDYNAKAGQEVECRSGNDGIYYDVTILHVDGEKVDVEFDDQTSEWTTLDKLRFYID